MLGLLSRAILRGRSAAPPSGSTSTLVLGNSQGPTTWKSSRPTTPSDHSTRWSPSSGEPFRRVGPYLLVEPLGAGSQAVVWRALRYEPPLQEVALKLVPIAERVDRRHVTRLRREAERGRRIRS